MSAHGNPNIIEDGLVFLYDVNNKKSYPGEPTTNLVTNPDFSTGLTGWSSTSTSNADVDITEVSSENGYNYFHKKANKTSNGGQDRLVQSSFYTIDTSKQTTISIDIWINPENDYSIIFYGRGTTVDDTTYDEKPLTNNGSTTSTVDLGNGWTRYIYTLQTGWYTGSGNTFLLAVYPAWTGRGLMEYKVRRVQVEQKPHATPFVSGTRSTTQGLIDRTGNKTITLANMSYDSNAQKYFDGTDDYISIPTHTFGNGDWTLNAWVNPDVVSGYNVMSNSSGGPVTNAFGFNGGKIHYRNYDGAWQTHDGNTTMSIYNWYMLTWVNYEGASASDGTMKMYVNGVADSDTFNSYTTNGGPCDVIGRNWTSAFYNGKIDRVTIHDKSLTDAEVLQTYNALKSRFGL